jgi:hypothetical protein
LSRGSYYYNTVIGRHDVTSSEGEKIAIAKEIPHPEYDRETLDNDIALIILSQSTTHSIPFVKLNSDDSFPSPGFIARILGWGDVDPRDEVKLYSDVLMMADLPVISNEECSQAKGTTGKHTDDFDGKITSNMICTFDPSGVDGCHGDR